MNACRLDLGVQPLPGNFNTGLGELLADWHTTATVWTPLIAIQVVDILSSQSRDRRRSNKLCCTVV